jgi:glycosyltransferase involved in cell wall biosynthesis
VSWQNPHNVLFITAAFPPLNSSGTQRSTKFVKYLGRFGWRPVVVTLDWEHDSLGNPLDYTMMQEIPEDVPVYRLKFFSPAVSLSRVLSKLRSRPDGSSEALAEVRTHTEVSSGADDRHGRVYRALRSVYHFTFAPVGDDLFYWSMKAAPTCLRLARQHRVQAIYVSVSPWSAALLGVFLKSRLRLPLIVDFRDYWTLWAVKFRRIIRDRLDAYFERVVLRHADRIICAHDTMVADFQQIERAAAGKCVVITNGYDPDDFRQSERESEVCGLRTEGFNLTHTGVVWADAAGPLLRVLDALKSDSRLNGFSANFIGGLPLSQLQFIRDRGLDRLVRIQKRIPHDEVMGYMKRADVLLLLLVSNEGGRKCYPGKLFEYLYAGKPVLAIAPRGIATDLIEQAGVGISVEPDENDRLRELLLLAVTDPEAFGRRFYHPRWEVIERYDRRKLTRRLAEVLDEVCGHRYQEGDQI